MTKLWLLLLPLALVAAVVALVAIVRQRPTRWKIAGIAMALGVLTWVGWLFSPPPLAVGTVGAIPQVAENGFVSSAACVECHPQQHASWYDSFHHTMTQVVTPDTVVAPFAGEVLESRDRPVRFWREGDSFFVDMVDPDWDAAQRAQGVENPLDHETPLVTREIVMSTGSHHYQTYWVNSVQGNNLRQVPWVYHLAEKRWLPAEDAFLTPPDGPRRQTVWNGVCIQCHAVGGQPGLDELTGSFQSQVAELGISCEACHGPGQRHVEHHRKYNVANSTGSTATETDATAGRAAGGVEFAVGDPTIVNPARLPHDRASQVCGQCHSYFSFTDAEFWKTGFKYRAGDDLDETRIVHHFDQQHVQSRPDLLAGYWGDGTMRIAGREFSAMDDSKCYQEGQLSCLSCHSMHGYQETSDQLAATMQRNEACLQCHETLRENLTQHTHHAADSTGSNCYNCHMPYTSFGLLKAIRSHRIDVPRATMTAQQGRPNACSLCHHDQSLQWAADRLVDWYGHDRGEMKAEQQQISSMLLHLLRGDAVQRAVAAWNLGWQPARDASAAGWQVPYLAMMLMDPYAGVRFAAVNSLKSYPGFEDLEVDYIGTDESRSNVMRKVIEQWRAALPAEVDWDPDTVLLEASGAMRIEQVQTLIRQRDDRAIELPE